MRVSRRGGRNGAAEVSLTEAAAVAAPRGRRSARLPVEDTGLVAAAVELDVLLVDPLVAVHAVPLGVVPEDVVPPVEQRIGLGVVDGVAVVAAGMLLDHPPRHVVHL